MKKIVWLLLILALILALGACTRSATGPLPTQSPKGHSLFPTALPTGVGNAAATQTAAVAGTPTKAPSGATTASPPTPPPTPTPAPTSAPPTPTPQPQPTPTPQAQPTPTAQTQPTPTAQPIATTVPDHYTLHQGEYPYCLARRFNIDPDALLNANGLVRGQWVYPGTSLVIPKQAGPFPYQRALRNHPTTYTVRAGDTLYSIACLFGDVWPEAIAQANGLGLNATLTPGQTLRIP